MGLGLVLDRCGWGGRGIIGAGAVVNKDVPPRSLVVGAPSGSTKFEAEVAELIEHAQRYKKLALVHAGKGYGSGLYVSP